MDHLYFHKQAFPNEDDQEKDLPVSPRALERAVIAAGRDPEQVETLGAHVQMDLASRVMALRSVVDMDGPVPKATQAFLEEGATYKTQKSFLVGNTFCAHSALQELHIPWLVDVETLCRHEPRLRIKTDASGRRPDFLGFDVDGNWHVFECKGRSHRPQPKEITDWKEQSRSITRVNNHSVKYHVVSATYMNRDKEWELLWVDPVQVARREESPEISPGRFLMIYYHEMVGLLLRRERGGEFTTGVLMAVLDKDLAVSAGLHEVVLNALTEAADGSQAPVEGVERMRWLGRRLSSLYGSRIRKSDPSLGPRELSERAVKELMSFAKDVCEQGGSFRGGYSSQSIFADGFVIRDEKERGDERPKEKAPRPSPTPPERKRERIFVEPEKRMEELFERRKIKHEEREAVATMNS